MDIFEITGYRTGVAKDGVNYLEPADSFQSIRNGYIYRQVLQSRQGFTQFSSGRLADGTRVMGIFEHTLPDSSKQLLVISKEFLYKFNEGTNTFDQVPMAGAAPGGGFAIATDEDYVSGTTYPFGDGSQRFVFTGKGMSDIYMYDGTNVLSFTNLVDNPDYQAPSGGALTNAWYVIYFGERLNLFQPLIGGLDNPQAVLYSAIRSVSGNGDKFNTVGAGLLPADTQEYLNGASILGNYIIGNFSRSNWVLEKTRDPFNPYIWRKVPGVIGTDAPFSFASWNNEIRSVGKTGIIATDSRESLRVDNKIPYFSTDDILPSEFNLTYGGFDRLNGQFLWSYKEAGTEGSTQDTVLVNNYEEGSWSVYDARFTVFGQTDGGLALTWEDIDETKNPSWAQWDTTEEIWNSIGVTQGTQKTLAGDDSGFIYQLNQDYDDYFSNITAITNAGSAVLTTSDQAFAIGDRVVIANVEGMTEINNFDPSNLEADLEPYTITAASLNSITVNANSTDWSAYTTGGSISKLILFEATMNPFNPYRDKGRKVFVSHLEFLLNTNSGFVYLDMYADEEESPFKSGVLLQPGSSTKERKWITAIVNQESDFLTFKIRQESPATQAVIISIRIHCRAGGMTSG